MEANRPLVYPAMLVMQRCVGLRLVPLLQALLSAAGIFIAASLTTSHLTGRALPCMGGGGCEELQRSGLAEVLGVPIAAFGLAGYACIFVLSIVDFVRPIPHPLVRIACMCLVLFGAIVSGGLALASLLLVHAVCGWCMMSGSLMFSLLGLSVLGQPGRAAVRPVGGRPAYFLTALGIVCICAGFVNGIGAGRISTINEAAVARTTAAELLKGHRLGPPGAPAVIAFSDLCCSACAFEIPKLARLAREGGLPPFLKTFQNESLAYDDMVADGGR